MIQVVDPNTFNDDEHVVEWFNIVVPDILIIGLSMFLPYFHNKF
jgi:hypothetical protein